MGCGPLLTGVLFPPLQDSGPTDTNATALPFESTIGEPDCPASVAPIESAGPRCPRGLLEGWAAKTNHLVRACNPRPSPAQPWPGAFAHLADGKRFILVWMVGFAEDCQVGNRIEEQALTPASLRHFARFNLVHFLSLCRSAACDFVGCCNFRHR